MMSTQPFPQSCASWRVVLPVMMFLFSFTVPFLGPGNVWADSEQEKFITLLSDLSTQLEKLRISNDMSLTSTILTTECSGDFHLSEGEIIRGKSRQTDRETGLELRGGYRTGDISDSMEDEDGLEEGTASLELSWELLKHGLLHNSRKAEALEAKAQWADLENDLKNLTRSYKCRRYHIKQEFSEMLIQLLKLKLDLIQPVYDIERRAYFKHWSFLDDYFVSEEDFLLTRHTLDALLSDPYYDGNQTSYSLPPIIDIDLAGLLKAIREDDSYSALYDIEKQWLKRQQNAEIYDSLRLYLRQDYDIHGDSRDERDLIAGLRFRVPLHSRKSEVLDLQLRRIDRKKNVLLHDRLNQTRIRYAELQEQLRRTVRQHYRYERAKERVKRTFTMVRKGKEHLLTAAITRMRTSIEAQIELVRAMEELYRRVNEMFLASRIPFQLNLLQRVDLQPEMNRARYGNRSLYVWSQDFNDIDNGDLRAFMEAKSISKLLLSDGKKMDREKQRRFLKTLEESGLRVELITGDNSWIFERNHEMAVQRSLQTAEKTGALHLDIEPQAMEEYQANRLEYIDLYVELIGKIKGSLLDHKLSLAVPFHWPRETYKELGKLADSLHIMAYGTTEPEVLLRRIRPILETVPHDKLTVVLRIDDFTDEWAIEKMIDNLAKKTALTNFGIHDLGRFVRMAGSVDEDFSLEEQLLKEAGGK